MNQSERKLTRLHKVRTMRKGLKSYSTTGLNVRDTIQWPFYGLNIFLDFEFLTGESFKPVKFKTTPNSFFSEVGFGVFLLDSVQKLSNLPTDKLFFFFVTSWQNCAWLLLILLFCAWFLIPWICPIAKLTMRYDCL